MSEELDRQLLAYKTCNDEKKKRMLHLQIVENAMQLVKKIACSIVVQAGISNEDLIQVGSIGLIKAIEFFDTDKNTKFKLMRHILSAAKLNTICGIKPL